MSVSCLKTPFRLLAPIAMIAVCGPSFAVDQNSYRPGKVYASNIVPAPQTCALQCTGDAQCYGWNYIPRSPANQSGICELTSDNVSAVSHPYAISGDNGGRSIGSSIIVQGQSTTHRIGTPESARPHVQVQHQAQQSINYAAPHRRPVQAPTVRQRVYAPQPQQKMPRFQAPQQHYVQPYQAPQQSSYIQRQAVRAPAQYTQPAPYLAPQVTPQASNNLHGWLYDTPQGYTSGHAIAAPSAPVTVSNLEMAGSY